jgi:tripartite-type tricarboxylate transporter receptor subunit TctC
VSAELFKMMAGVYGASCLSRGAPLTDLFGGHVHVMVDNLPSSIQYIRAGGLRALGVSSPTRLDLLPDVPAVAQTVPGFETAAFAGIAAPKDTSASIIDKLKRRSERASQTP